MVEKYLNGIIRKVKTGKTTEHSFRGDLQDFIERIVIGIQAINEPRRQKCGAPDYIIQKKNIPIGYIEAKDIDKNLDIIEKSEQLNRYRGSLNNLILTNYLEFRYFVDGEKVYTIKVADIENGSIKVNPKEYDKLVSLIRNFCDYQGQTIKSPKQLANLMAQKAVMIRDVIISSLEKNSESSLVSQRNAFKQILLHDLTDHTFADMYAQTIAYGLFVARLNDTTLENFSRQEARELVSKNNPFLRQLFDYISGANLDENLVWIVDDLVEIFRAVDLNRLLHNYGHSTGMNDPFLHFYETFLESYDKVNKEKRGVYYTPLPVVRFIVRAVDDILKTEFNLPHGLADDTKVKYKRFVYVDTSNKRAKQPKEVWSEEEIYKVQILDPATGTGTFLAETIRKIYEYFVNQKGIWSQYVDNALIPRLNGFEIMMTPYVMCHLKLDLLLQDTGYITTKQTNRFNVYLTNALEKDETTKYPLFDWLSEEARQAGKIKSEKPIMVVMGNPPYSVSSCNKNEYIDELMEVYKQDLNERNIQPLSDDYIKFIRMGESFIEKNKEGILAYISNNSFLDGVIHRQMRKHLLETFDKIYVINLHGNAKKKECCADGSKDENVFDIQQGVSINIFIKTNSDNKESAKVYYKDLYGLRVDKYAYLDNNNMATVDYTELIPVEPYYFFVPKDFGLQEEYEKGVKVDELFLVNTSGVKTHHDNELVSLYPFDTKTNRLYSYKPFDTRYINYDLSRVVRHRYSVMKHFVLGKNIGLCLMRSLVNTELYNTVFLSHSLSDINFYGFQSYTFPLYQYNDSASEQVSFFTQNREPNLNMDIVHEFESKLGLIFTVEKETTDGTFAPIDILDYIYGVLHSNTYRTKYKEFLKIDFPRIPYPKDSDYFFKVAELGRQIREIHLFDSPVLNNLVTLFPIDGDCEVIKPEYKDGKVYINAAQYFDGVPEQAWNFYIGGYQPAQKWLKDRKRRILSYEDIIHYQKIIVALEQTNRLMQAIDEIIII
jgi:adenine specific DNA methyltransferase